MYIIYFLFSFTFRTRGSSGDIQHSTAPPSTTWTSPHSQTRQARKASKKKRWAGSAPPPVQVALPFLWATVQLKFARNWRSQCAKTCDCHSAPWPMGGMNGTVTTRLVGGATGAWGLHRSLAALSTQELTCLLRLTCTNTHTHTHAGRLTLGTLMVTCTHTHTCHR